MHILAVDIQTEF